MNCGKLFVYMGYYANSFSRETARCVERLTRPMPQEKKAYWAEMKERCKRILIVSVSLPLAAALAIPSMAFYAAAACSGQNRFDSIHPTIEPYYLPQRSVKVMSLNACFQDPWSPLTGGVVTPFEKVSDHPTRIAAIVDAVAKENPTLFLGQEFENLGAQDESIRLFEQKGYRYFLRDLGTNEPMRNNSGLFAASKIPLNDSAFVPYPLADRAGLAKWSGQGALSFTIPLKEKTLRLVNVHLNYGGGLENQEARNRQLKNHVIPMMKKGNGVLMGDLNFDTATVDRAVSGLTGFTNALEGKTTCTDAGKHALRGKSLTPDGKPCEDCEEKIDGLIYDPNEIEIHNVESKPLLCGNQLLSDHYATIATLQIRSET